MIVESEQLESGISEALRYYKLEMVLADIEPSVNRAKAMCPVHGEWWFERIGETAIFKCMHADHEGRKAKGEDLRPKIQR